MNQSSCIGHVVHHLKVMDNWKNSDETCEHRPV